MYENRNPDVAVESALYAVWRDVLITFFIHPLVHIIQFVLYRKYVPVIITSLITGPYCIFALYFLNLRIGLNWPNVFTWTAISAVVLIINLVFVHPLAARFEKWLGGEFAQR